MANNTTFSDKLPTVSQQATLRKSVSAIGFNGGTTEKNWKNFKVLLVNYVYENAAIFMITEDGLVMSSSSINDHHLDMTATALTPYEQVLSQGRAVSSASLTSHPTPLKEHSSDGQQRLQNHGVVPGAQLLHHGGFFSKPIVRSNEESFRYLMALDR
ncbi:unnamed protein product [Haemonchus placei]|uniref:Late endosomal/lysosomal adaptor and MAPK and MTOR activator 5 n=1 Tax=Haemonchus placei TaxID=6290 RepID=A0A0N4X1T5_HAEPC|nr:unnamed protein product [Haemonchus placei]